MGVLTLSTSRHWLVSPNSPGCRVRASACLFTVTVTRSVLHHRFLFFFSPDFHVPSEYLTNIHIRDKVTLSCGKKCLQISFFLIIFMDRTAKLIVVWITVPPLPAVGSDQTGSIWRRPAVLPVLHEWRRPATTAGSSRAVSHPRVLFFPSTKASAV